jgi:hypothetical protein
MLRRCVPLALVCVAGGTAAAQPVTRPEREPCHVNIAFAPDDVRDEIEAWVRAEPRCVRELEVRVLPVDDGLYLQARDQEGRVRERVVPDGQSAAVLVVSWMADDSLDPVYPPILTPPSRSPSSAATSDDEMPADLDDRVERIAPSFGHVRSGRRWLTLGAMGSPRQIGVRGELDLFAGRHWSLGVAGGWLQSEHGHDGLGQARIVLGMERSFGRFSVRAQLGVGADVGGEHMDHDAMELRMESRHDNDLVPKVEAAVFARFHVSDAWGLIGGPVVEASPRDRPSISIFLGVQRAL